MEQPPAHPIEPARFATLTPSSRASLPKLLHPSSQPAKPKMAYYTMTIQRRDRSGRWNQVATWAVTTDEEDMAGPLSMGLKENYRLIIKQGKPPDNPPAEDIPDAVA